MPIPYPYELGSAVVAALSVSPLIAIVDKAIFSNASGKATLKESVSDGLRSLLLKPHHFIRDKSFLWIWMVYSGTYVTKNCTERFVERQKRPNNQVQGAVFITSAGANMSLSLLKDRAFSRYYGVTAARPVPLISSACFAVRDLITIGASFTAINPIAKKIEEYFGVPLKAAQTASQLTVPMIAQVFNTPIFIIGMDIYNNPDNSAQKRVGAIRRLFSGTFLSRCARIFPAFGIGGVLNSKLRAMAKERVAHQRGQTAS